MSTPTCPYCGSIINAPFMKDDLSYCEFCNDYVHCSEDGKRKSRYNIRIIDYEFMNMDLPELKELHLVNLLEALRIARKDRQSYFGNMSVIKKAAKQSAEFKIHSVTAGNEYERVTKKVRQIENIILDRMGYIPAKVTDELIIKVREKCEDPKNQTIMKIKKGDKIIC